MCLYLIIGAVFLVNALVNGARLYQSIQSPAEYVLMGNEQNAASNANLREISGLENVTALSRQRETIVSIKYQANETDFSCVELSETYMEAVYGIRESGAMKTFYMNRKAYGQLKKDEYGPEENSDNNELHVNYTVGNAGDAPESRMSGTARIVLVQNGMPEEPFVFCKGDGKSLSENTADIRAYVRRQDVDGKDVARLQGFGFTLVNEKEVQETGYFRQIQLVKIQYGGAAAALSLMCAGFLWRFFGRKAMRDEI